MTYANGEPADWDEIEVWLDENDTSSHGLNLETRVLELEAYISKLQCFVNCVTGNGGYTFGKSTRKEVLCSRCMILQSNKVVKSS